MVTGNSTILLPHYTLFLDGAFLTTRFPLGKSYDRCTAINTFSWSHPIAPSFGMSDRCRTLQWAGPSMARRR